jgi:hypothetical protein
MHGFGSKPRRAFDIDYLEFRWHTGVTFAVLQVCVCVCVCVCAGWV